MKYLFSILLTAFAFMATAERIITGTVIDIEGNPIEKVQVQLVGYLDKTLTDANGIFAIRVIDQNSELHFSKTHFADVTMVVGRNKSLKVQLMPKHPIEKPDALLEVVEEEDYMASPAVYSKQAKFYRSRSGAGDLRSVNHNTEGYAPLNETGFRTPQNAPLSTFSLDVDVASYSNVRRFLKTGQLPPKDAVRIEEFINYFNYDYEGPKDDAPFAVHSELSKSPWNAGHLLLKVALQGKRLNLEKLPPSHLTFLIDVSGSMQDANKLPLLKSSLKMLASELRDEDKVSIVVYAGAAGLVLEPTSNKTKIFNALDNLEAGGSTAGGAGLNLAYEIAGKHFLQGGNNRVILATDGDFNVGASSNAEMMRLIESKRDQGIYMTVLGFGMGNYKDDKMELIADKGNGNYAYIDQLLEAKKVLVNEFGGTMHTIAKDVKFQLEFNPSRVSAYRLIGYENRRLNAEDFNDDKKDAGEMGSGHVVTAIYEIVPKGVNSSYIENVDPLKYQNVQLNGSDDWVTLKLRYKEPTASRSQLIEKVIKKKTGKMSDNFKWASAVAGFGLLLSDSKYAGPLTYDKVLGLAQSSIGEKDIYKMEFLELVETAKALGLSSSKHGR